MPQIHHAAPTGGLWLSSVPPSVPIRLDPGRFQHSLENENVLKACRHCQTEQQIGSRKAAKAHSLKSEHACNREVRWTENHLQRLLPSHAQRPWACTFGMLHSSTTDHDGESTKPVLLPSRRVLRRAPISMGPCRLNSGALRAPTAGLYCSPVASGVPLWPPV